jgi:hypothetical protein
MKRVASSLTVKTECKARKKHIEADREKNLLLGVVSIIETEII